jgi:sulfate permease, SulP family
VIKPTLAAFADRLSAADWRDRELPPFTPGRIKTEVLSGLTVALAQKYETLGKTIQLRHLSPDCHRLLNRAGQLMVDSDDDPSYGIAVDYSIKTGIMGSH